jgi:hypothetical protein
MICLYCAFISAVRQRKRRALIETASTSVSTDARQGLSWQQLELPVGDRNTLGQPERRGEILAMKAPKVLRWLIPTNYQSIKAETVATALLAKVPGGTGKTILLSGSMQP